MSSNLRDFLGDGDDKKPKKFVIVSSAALLAVGNEGANKGFWRIQLRDDNGNWIPMGGAVTFEVDLPDIGKVFGTGTYQGKSKDDPNNIVIRVKNHSKIPDGDYSIPPENLEESAEAIIPADDLERITNGVDSLLEQTPELKDEITGDEALKTIRSAIAKDLKEQGRFPVVRSDKDIEDTVSKQYKSLFAQIQKENPELLKTSFNKDIPNEDLFWDYIKANFATGQMTTYTSPDQLPPLQKLVNQLYAEKFLGVKRDGLISFYRNNIRGKETEAEAAAGYASLDKYMAFDYNVDRGKYEGGRNTGRYEIKARPDEITGLLGFSNLGDEIGAVISPEVTSIPGRVTRLGDLEIPDPDNAPWFDLKNLADFDRSTGGSPFRQHRPLGQFDYYGLDEDPFGGGEDWGSFYEAHGLEMGAIPAKYDELYGEGAWERDWERYRPSAKYFKALFKQYTDKDGKKKWGLQGQYLWNMGSTETDYYNPQANDGLDKHLKLLSTMQELIGKPFFVSRGHDPNDPRLKNITKEDVASSAPQEVVKKSSGALPLDFSKFDKISGPLGSNAGGTYQDPATGKKYYVKIQDKERGDNEALASALYREVGLDALEVKYGVLDGSPVTYTEWRDGLTPLVPKWNDLVLQGETDKAVEGFLIDAWIANWDVVGTGYDNISIDKNNNPVRLDSGGSLLYRARGARKGDAFGNEVNELKTFKDPSNTTERIYGSMYLHPEGERASYEKLKSITPERIDELVDQYISNPKDNKELKEKLKARQKFILDSYKDSPLIKSKLYGSVTTQNVSKEEKSSIKNYTNAGYLEINKYLRDPENPKHQGSKKAAENINNIIKANTLNEDTILHRITRNFDNDYEPGDIIEDLGIQSTTKAGKSSIHSTVLNKLYPELGPDGAEFQGYTTYTIKAPAGTAALDVTQMSLFRSEGEVLLPAGTKFKVISYERKPMGEPYTGSYRNIEVEIIPETVKEQSPKSGGESKDGDVEWFDDSEENLTPKSDTVMVSEDGLTTIQPGQVIDMDVDGKTVPFRYTGTALADIFSDDTAGAFGLYEGSYIFELTNSPNEKNLPNGFYLIYSDDIDTLPEDPTRLPEFVEEDHNVFIGTKLPIKRSYKEQISMNAYGGFFYRDLNDALNNNLDLSTLVYGSVDMDGNYIVSGLDSFVEKSTISEDTTLWRGISTSDPAYKKFLQSLKPGDILKQNSYMSTSRDKVSASYFLERTDGGFGADDLSVLFKINAKKGTKGAEMFKTILGPMAYEREVLLPRGDKMTDSLVVTKVEKDKYDPLLLHIEFDYLPETPAFTAENPPKIDIPEKYQWPVENFFGVDDYSNSLVQKIHDELGVWVSSLPFSDRYNMMEADSFNDQDTKITKIDGLVGPKNCYQNVAEAVRNGWDGDVYLGFSSDSSGSAQGHAWLMKDGEILETTSETRAKYFGKKLNKEEIEKFLSDYPSPPSDQKEQAPKSGGESKDGDVEFFDDTEQTEKETQAMFSYRSSGYKTINNYLRQIDTDPTKKRSSNSKMESTIAAIDSLIEKQTPTTEKMTVYRGISGSYAEKLLGLSVGDIVDEPGFSSSAKSQRYMWPFAYGNKKPGVELHLTLPEGSKFVDVDKFIPEEAGPFEIARENEALLPRGLKFRIDSIDKSTNTIYATVIADKEKEEAKSKVSEPSKSDISFSADDVVADYINSDDGTYFRVGDTIKRKNPDTGEVEETKIESENDAFASGATLSYFETWEESFFNSLKFSNEEQVIDFIKDWNKRNPNRRVYVDPFRLKFKISKNAKKLNMDPADESSWVDATYDAVLQYAEYENKKALTDALIEFEEKFPGVSKFAQGAVKDRKATKIFAEDIKDSKVVVAVSSAFFRTILGDGRLKTQFETNFSKGTYDPLRRAKKELSTFGVPLDTDPKNRPIYAYLTLPNNPERDKYFSNPQNLTIVSKAVNHYGDLRFVLKDSAKKKTTFTMQDSLGSSMRNGAKLSDNIDENTILEAGFLRSPNGEDYPLETTYIEAQVHDGVSLDDVEKIVIPYSSTPDNTWNSRMTKEQAEQLMEQYKSLMEKKGISIPIELVDGDLAEKPAPELPEEIKALKERLRKADPISYGSTDKPAIDTTGNRGLTR